MYNTINYESCVARAMNYDTPAPTNAMFISVAYLSVYCK